jgi:signal transduction histidine kinase/FixJ family two-component response regulator
MRKKLSFALGKKVLLTTLVGVLAVIALNYYAGMAFDRITGNVDRLSRPNERLTQVNILFRRVSRLNNLQQKEAAEGRRTPSREYLREETSVRESIDTLKLLFLGDSIQEARLISIEELLRRSRAVFREYMSLQYQQSRNQDLKSLLSGTKDDIRRADSLINTIVQTHKTTTTTTVSIDTIQPQRTSFIKRLFGGSPEKESSTVMKDETKVEQAVEVKIDTLGLYLADRVFAEIGNSLDSVQAARIQEATILQTHQFRLMNVNNNLIRQLISVINDLEQEEISRLHSETQSAFKTASDTLTALIVISLIFLVVSVLLVLVIMSDITKSNRYRKQLEAAHEAARREAINKQKFLSNMSHEIRTPLQVIYGYAEQAKLGGRDHVDLEAVYHPASHLLRVVDEVLDYAKVTSGALTFASEPFKVTEELEKVRGSLRSLAEKKNIELQCDLADGADVVLLGDAFRLRQVVFNLAGNAIKFTEKGYVRISAEVSELDEAFLLKLSVDDTGIGIAPEQLSHLFLEFSQATPEVSSQYGGTGLGLSIVKAIVEQQGGHIEVDSKPGEGSTFTVFIPYQGYIEASYGAVQNTVVSVGQHTVWMADDDPLIQKLASAIFEKHGIAHRTFNNGSELLKAFDGSKPDLIFLDMRMPGMSGLEVHNRIRDRVGHSVKVYALTAQVLPHEKEEMEERGFDGIIGKPFREADLIAVMADVELPYKELNTSSIEKMAGDDRELILSILESVRDESLKDIELIRKAYESRSADDFMLVVHRLAGRAGQCGASDFSALLRGVELQIGEKGEYPSDKEFSRLINDGRGFISSLEHRIGDFTSKQE